MAPPVAWQTQPPQRSPEVPVKGLRARPEGRPRHGRLGVAHTEVTGFTCRGAGRSPSGMHPYGAPMGLGRLELPTSRLSGT